MHGKVTEIHTCGTGLFARLPESFHVTRYHSLVINGSSLPDDYQVDAISEDGAQKAAVVRGAVSSGSGTYGVWS